MCCGEINMRKLNECSSAGRIVCGIFWVFFCCCCCLPFFFVFRGKIKWNFEKHTGRLSNNTVMCQYYNVLNMYSWTNAQQRAGFWDGAWTVLLRSYNHDGIRMCVLYNVWAHHHHHPQFWNDFTNVCLDVSEGFSMCGCTFYLVWKC